ncbi:hypothetical protein K502DRAFT_300217 [Neoconidiobolus thromboides FSU 785]|nr:hypothetical protein K502DRAFT_300217 [Neoconidiobolus thromboides FSU 785]
MMNRISTSLRLSSLASRSSRVLRGGGGGGYPYNEPGGRLFNEKPLQPGEKRVKEEWEGIWFWGWTAFFTIGFVGYYYKPDNSISTWAYHEAKRRMEERGENWDYERTPISTEFLPKKE